MSAGHLGDSWLFSRDEWEGQAPLRQHSISGGDIMPMQSAVYRDTLTPSNRIETALSKLMSAEFQRVPKARQPVKTDSTSDHIVAKS